jgi:hypothetical protein
VTSISDDAHLQTRLSSSFGWPPALTSLSCSVVSGAVSPYERAANVVHRLTDLRLSILMHPPNWAMRGSRRPRNWPGERYEATISFD